MCMHINDYNMQVFHIIMLDDVLRPLWATVADQSWDYALEYWQQQRLVKLNGLRRDVWI